MPKTITAEAVEEATFAIDVSFTDENGVAATPNAGLNWTLTDVEGNVINGREEIIVGTPASTVTIVLTGNDLALPDRDRPWRVLIIEGTYNSSLGSNLPLKEEGRFRIRNLTRVPVSP